MVESHFHWVPFVFDKDHHRDDGDDVEGEEDGDGVFMLLIIMISTPPTKVERGSCHILRNPSSAPPPRCPKT